MEIPVVLGMLGLGYIYSQKKEERNRAIGTVANAETDLAAGIEPKNIYDSNRALEIRRAELELGARVFAEPNRIMPGPPKIDPTLLFNKVDYADNRLPIEFSNLDSYRGDLFDDKREREPEDRRPIDIYNSNSPVGGGWEGISLSGEPIDRKNFVHNNMVPFFGGRVKQNVDDKVNATLMENFTGNVDNYKSKTEIGPLFQAQNNTCNPYGMASITDFMQDRIVPPKVMNNVGPIEQVRVGPGLNQGYTAEPSGGFQQANTRDYVMPKTVDELRTKNNPKMTYYGRILAGMKPARLAGIGAVEKRRPDSYYENTPDRWLTTTGAFIAEKQRPNIVLKDTSRRITSTRTRIGSAVSTVGNKDNIRPTARPSRRIPLKADHVRHLNMAGRWSACDADLKEAEAKQMISLHDYGKSRMNVRETERQFDKESEYRGPTKVGHLSHKRDDQNARETRRRLTELARKNAGQVGNQGTKMKLRHCDEAKTTLKQQFIDNTHSGFIHGDRVANPPVYDPNDVARTTVKETTMLEDHYGAADSYGKNPALRNCEPARATTKETTLGEDYVGTGYQGRGGGYQTNKMVAKTTIKETTADVAYTGNASSKNKQPVSYVDMYNSTVRSLREQVSRGRAPTLSGPKVMQHDVNMTTRRMGDMQNGYLNDRGLAPTKVYNSLPTPEICGTTRDKTTLPNENIQDRLDPCVLDQLNSNPYTMRRMALAGRVQN